MEVIYSPSKRFELSFYRNQLIHLFVGEGMPRKERKVKSETEESGKAKQK